MAADFADIRFVGASDNALPYWIESYVSSTSAIVWVKVASGATAISLIYGNAAATSESNPVQVFEFWEDFATGTLDTGIWATQVSGAGATVAVADGLCSVYGGNSAILQATAAYAFAPGYALRCRFAFPIRSGGAILIGDGELNLAAHIYQDDNFQGAHCYSGTDTPSNTFQQAEHGQTVPSAAYHIYDIARTGGATNVTRHVVDGVLILTSTAVTPDARRFTARTTGVNRIDIDWIAYRKTQAVEPVCTVGTAESNSPGHCTATRYLSGSITETGGHFVRSDTVTASRYIGGSIAGVTNWRSTVTATRYLSGSITVPGTTIPTGYSLIVDGVNYTTSKVINIQVRDRLNQLPRFDFRAHSLDDHDLTHFRANATVVIKYNDITRCEGFIERFDNQQSSHFYDCTGYGVGRYLDYRRSDVPTLFPVGLQGENTVKDIISYVVNTSCGYPTTGANAWNVEGDGGPDLLIYKIQNQKALQHVAQLVDLADMDWRCAMATEGYTLTLNPEATVHTATTLKINRDIIKSEIVTDLSKVSNNIVIQSNDCFGNTILSSIGDYTNVCKVASSETLLKYDAQSGTTLLYVFDHSDFPSSGSCFVSTEVVEYDGKSDPSSANHPHFYGLTTTASHTAYEPVLFRDGFCITGATAPFIDADSGTILVGREQISYASIYSVDATTAMVSGTLSRGVSTTPIYAHGREAPVFDMSYSLASPTSTTSVATFGRKDEVISGLGYQDMNSLDLAAYGVLQRKCGFPTWGQASIVGGDWPTGFATTPKVGDWVYIEDATTTATTMYRITGLDYNQMQGSIIINWGQNEEFAVSDLTKGDIAQNQAMS